jgi:hypothetical protein
MTYEQLLQRIENSNEAMIYTSDGDEYLIHNPNTDNDGIIPLYWYEDSLSVLDSEGTQEEIDYSEIVDVRC